jgi:hypothetical protein
MKIVYVRWRDARSEEAVEPHSDVVPTLCTLNEVGFFLGETDEALTIGMELEGDGETAPGRWRLHIPKVLIQEIRTVDVAALLKKKQGKAAIKKT